MGRSGMPCHRGSAVSAGVRTASGFDGLARHYDLLMGFVNYDRWETTCSVLSELLTRDFQHVDFACGTGVLVERFRKRGWRSQGLDLSRLMLASGLKDRGKLPVACADLRACPLRESVDLATCLFDSLNFLLEPEDLAKSFSEMAQALRPGGLLYVDVVTERMILDHFVGPEWTEQNGRVSLRWKTRYNRQAKLAETTVRINTGAPNVFRERVYPMDFLLDCIAKAGLMLLGAYDAHGWKAPSASSVRLDFVAVKPPHQIPSTRYAALELDIQSLVRGMPDTND
ncbi:MAG: hypothetical protein RLZZ303_3736 [Candidatus Hydrogenedentota bacterium]